VNFSRISAFDHNEHSKPATMEVRSTGSVYDRGQQLIHQRKKSPKKEKGHRTSQRNKRVGAVKKTRLSLEWRTTMKGTEKLQDFSRATLRKAGQRSRRENKPRERS
jgi:hypothetical protein